MGGYGIFMEILKLSRYYLQYISRIIYDLHFEVFLCFYGLTDISASTRITRREIYRPCDISGREWTTSLLYGVLFKVYVFKMRIDM